MLQTCFFLGADVVEGAEEAVECDVGDSCGEEEGDSGRYGEFGNWE